VTSGGIKTGSSFVQNIQTSLNIDTARAGLWQGGLIHLTAQSRYGDSPEDTFTAGTFVPQYTGLVEPDPLLSHETDLSEWFLVQALSKKTSVVLGKISDIFIPDQTLFGDSYKYFFDNFNFNKNPMTTNFYRPVGLAALGVWAPMKGLVFGGGLLDPNSKANNFATDAFDSVNLYGTAIAGFRSNFHLRRVDRITQNTRMAGSKSSPRQPVARGAPALPQSNPQTLIIKRRVAFP
jgi:hypothetical protein